jgi:hypothetical protein
MMNEDGMSRRRYRPEQIVYLAREAGVGLSPGPGLVSERQAGPEDLATGGAEGAREAARTRSVDRRRLLSSS